MRGASEELVVKRALLVESREHSLAYLEQRKAGEFGVQVVRCVHEVICPHALARIDHLLSDLTSTRDHDDQHAGAAESDELDALQHTVVTACEREADMTCRP